MFAISYLSHVYLAQYGQYFPRFSYFAFISLASGNYEKLGIYWSHCTRNRAITNTYCNTLVTDIVIIVST